MILQLARCSLQPRKDESDNFIANKQRSFALRSHNKAEFPRQISIFYLLSKQNEAFIALKMVEKGKQTEAAPIMEIKLTENHP